MKAVSCSYARVLRKVHHDVDPCFPRFEAGIRLGGSRLSTCFGRLHWQMAPTDEVGDMHVQRGSRHYRQLMSLSMPTHSKAVSQITETKLMLSACH